MPQLDSIVPGQALTLEELPVDLITRIQLSQDHYGRWDADLALREVILFNGAPASIPLAVAHVVKELLDWLPSHPDARSLLDDRDFLRRAAFESLRLHPASPFLIRKAVADADLGSGVRFSAGEHVVVDLLSASRDPAVFAHPERFDPDRPTGEKARPGGLAFGTGPHTCIGMALSVGDAQAGDGGAQGLMVLILRELFRRGVHLDPDRPPRFNDVNVRNEYATFPICFFEV